MAWRAVKAGIQRGPTWLRRALLPPPPTTRDLVARRLLYPVKEAAGMIGVSRPTLYKLYHQGRLELTRIDGRTFVRAAELERYAAAEGGPPHVAAAG